MTTIPRVAAFCAVAITLTGCDPLDRLEGASPSRAHIEMRQALIIPDPVPEPEPVVAVVEAPPPIEPDPPPMPVCRFSDAGFLICT